MVAQAAAGLAAATLEKTENLVGEKGEPIEVEAHDIRMLPMEAIYFLSKKANDLADPPDFLYSGSPPG